MDEDCTAYSEQMTSHALGELADSRRTRLHMQQRTACGRHGRHLENNQVISEILFRQSMPINQLIRQSSIRTFAKFHPHPI